jgi:hypothetical protein
MTFIDFLFIQDDGKFFRMDKVETNQVLESRPALMAEHKALKPESCSQVSNILTISVESLKIYTFGALCVTSARKAPHWPNGYGICLRSRGFQVRVLGVVQG